MNNKLAIKLFLFLFVATLAGCSGKEDIFEKFPPEILYKRFEYDSSGSGSWKVSPDALEITLESGQTEWTVRARVSAPNELVEVKLMTVSGADQNLLQTYTEFPDNLNVTEIEYELTDIKSQITVRLEATDRKGMLTRKDFTIK